ncbi:hypothetical protein [Aquabacterium sp.]|uniref:hypothetical protein n=1 Tax=Aquabacterium sp. TaxID=1872578 RepID=UPI0035B16540
MFFNASEQAGATSYCPSFAAPFMYGCEVPGCGKLRALIVAGAADGAISFCVDRQPMKAQA